MDSSNISFQHFSFTLSPPLPLLPNVCICTFAGQAILQLPQVTLAYCVRVVFKCHETRGKTRHVRTSMDKAHHWNGNSDPPLFEVESVIWGKVKEGECRRETEACFFIFIFYFFIFL